MTVIKTLNKEMIKYLKKLQKKGEDQRQKAPQNNIEVTQEKDQIEVTENSPENKTTISTSRTSLPKRKRVHSLRKHREEIKRRLRELD